MKAEWWAEVSERLGLDPRPNEKIKPGDLYLAKRNGPPELLTCKSISEREYVIPIENAYCYDTWECIKVVSVSPNTPDDDIFGVIQE